MNKTAVLETGRREHLRICALSLNAEVNWQRCNISGVEKLFELDLKGFFPLKGSCFNPWCFKEAFTFGYDRCPLTSGYKFRVVIEPESPGPWFVKPWSNCA